MAHSASLGPQVGPRSRRNARLANLESVSPTQTLIDDAALLGDAPDLTDALARWTSATPSPASLVATDVQLTALNRLASDRRTSDRLSLDRRSPDDCAFDDRPLPVTVVNTTGAGGLVSLAARSTPHLEVVAVRSALRDLDDLTGNAARVVSAASELGEEIEVYVELPDAWGWERAAEVVEMAGLFAGLAVASDNGRAGTDHLQTDPTLTTRMSVLIELDLGFALDARAMEPSAVPGLIAAVDALIDDASPGAAQEWLGRGTAVDLSSWDTLRRARVARRLRRVLVPDVAATHAALAHAGLA